MGKLAGLFEYELCLQVFLNFLKPLTELYVLARGFEIFLLSYDIVVLYDRLVHKFHSSPLKQIIEREDWYTNFINIKICYVKILIWLKNKHARDSYCDKIRLYVPSLDLSGLHDFLLNYTSSMLDCFDGPKKKKKKRKREKST